MKLIKYFENFNSDNLKVCAFDDLPYKYKLSIIIYMYEGDSIEWSQFDIEDWIKDKSKVDKLIDDYSKIFGDRKFEYGELSLDFLINEIMPEVDFYTFDEYHNWYITTGEVKKHETILPIIVTDKNVEFIEDGWHRFHHYVNIGLKNIPVVKLS